MNIPNKKHAKVVELYKQGWPLDHIAHETGFARASSVSEIASRYGCELRRPVGIYGERDAEIYRMAQDGMRAPQIADVFGISAKAVNSAIGRYRGTVPANDGASETRIKAFSASPAAIARAMAKHRGVSA